MPPVIKGDGTVHLTGVHYRYDQQKGWVVDYEYAGTAGGIDALVATSGDADQIDSKQDGASRTAVITYAGSDPINGNGGEEVFDTWELLGNDIEKDAYQHPEAYRISVKGIAEVRNAVKTAEDNPDWSGFATSETNNDVAGAAEVLFIHQMHKIDGFLIPQYVLRRTSTVPTRSNVKASFTNTFKIHTTAQLKAAESIPASILFSVDEIDSHLPSVPTDEFNYPRTMELKDGRDKDSTMPLMKWGWLKRTPTVSQTGGNKFSLTYEYWHALWSTWLYPEVV